MARVRDCSLRFERGARENGHALPGLRRPSTLSMVAATLLASASATAALPSTASCTVTLEGLTCDAMSGGEACHFASDPPSLRCEGAVLGMECSVSGHVRCRVGTVAECVLTIGSGTCMVFTETVACVADAQPPELDCKATLANFDCVVILSQPKVHVICT